MQNRADLQALFEEILESPNVYFQRAMRRYRIYETRTRSYKDLMRIKIVVQIKMGGTLSQGNMTKSRKKI